ncbi:ABC transporter ATP-binding protein [Actinocrinis sp.]|uniref:ABC transporter ATP-binding protein n=1 Tax=Actinocrinis sp. TaxID=1920516 RepID=UPI002D47D073|nr:ABC transporter ATP-binding protein [Actinocrinis sp.]HZP51668.1 ABC transporter ATP-binding protein [Actinocrinis sp.]
MGNPSAAAAPAAEAAPGAQGDDARAGDARPGDAQRGWTGLGQRPVPALAIEELTWRVGGRAIVDRVGFAAEPGELLAVIGPNGAGKTSLFNLISGLIRPDEGRIALGGHDVTRLPTHRRVRHGLGRTFQTSSVFPGLSVAENAQLAAQAALAGPLGCLAVWRRIGRPARERAQQALERCRLGHRAFARAGSLSHGEKRKLELAILLAAKPSVLLLDEPMAGMAMEEVPELTELIREVHRDGATILMVEHHMEVVLGLAQRVAVLHHGALLACDRPAAVVDDPTVREAYLGEPL